MASLHTLYTPATAAEVSAKLVAEEATLAALVSHNYEDEFFAPGKAGAPIQINQPTTLVARQRDMDNITDEIVLDLLNEQSTTINLNRVMDYSAVGLSEADMALRIDDAAKRIFKPQAKAIVASIEGKVEAKLKGVPVTLDGAIGGGATWDAANPVPYFTRIRKHLRGNGVPLEGINVLVGAEIFANLLDANVLTDVSQSGSTAALREAQIGRLRGLTIVESLRVDDDEVIAFHRDAVTLATRAPAVPAGQEGAVTAEGGISMRYLRDYLVSKTLHRSFLSTFSGVAILPTYKVTRTYTEGASVAAQAPTGTVSLVEIPNGGILHVVPGTVA